MKITLALLLLCTTTAAAQTPVNDRRPSVTGGLAVPIVIPREYSNDLARDVGLSLWMEGAFPVISRVSFNSGLEFAIPYRKEFRRSLRVTGTGTYQETVLSQSVQIRLNGRGPAEISAMGGFGFVIMRITEDASVFTPGYGSSRVKTNETRFDPSVLGGLTVSTALNELTNVTVDVRVRATRRHSDKIGNEFGTFNVAPSVGFRFALGRTDQGTH